MWYSNGCRDICTLYVKEVFFMAKTAMLVVDMQNALILEHPYDEKRLVKTVAQMEEICRQKGIEVIFLRHEDNNLVRGENGFEIYVWPRR